MSIVELSIKVRQSSLPITMKIAKTFPARADEIRGQTINIWLAYLILFRFIETGSVNHRALLIDCHKNRLVRDLHLLLRRMILHSQDFDRAPEILCTENEV